MTEMWRTTTFSRPIFGYYTGVNNVWALLISNIFLLHIEIFIGISHVRGIEYLRYCLVKNAAINYSGHCG